jgi:hypothetical protein
MSPPLLFHEDRKSSYELVEKRRAFLLLPERVIWLRARAEFSTLTNILSSSASNRLLLSLLKQKPSPVLRDPPAWN